jgi:hypothetical protein
MRSNNEKEEKKKRRRVRVLNDGKFWTRGHSLSLSH